MTWHDILHYMLQHHIMRCWHHTVHSIMLHFDCAWSITYTHLYNYYHSMSYHVTSCSHHYHIMSHHVTSCRLVASRLISYRVVSCCMVLYCTVSCCALSHLTWQLLHVASVVARSAPVSPECALALNWIVLYRIVLHSIASYIAALARGVGCWTKRLRKSRAGRQGCVCAHNANYV